MPGDSTSAEHTEQHLDPAVREILEEYRKTGNFTFNLGDKIHNLADRDPRLAGQAILKLFERGAYQDPPFWNSLYYLIEDRPDLAKDIIPQLYNRGAHQHDEFWNSLYYLIEDRPYALPPETIHHIILDGFKKGAYKHSGFRDSLDSFLWNNPGAFSPETIRRIILDGLEKGSHQHDEFWEFFNTLIEDRPDLAKDIIPQLYNRGAHQHDEFWNSLNTLLENHPDLAKDLIPQLHNHGANQHDDFWWTLNIFLRNNPDALPPETIRHIILDGFKKGAHQHSGFRDSLYYLLRNRPDLAKDIIPELYNRGVHQHDDFWDFLNAFLDNHPEYAHLLPQGILAFAGNPVLLSKFLPTTSEERRKLLADALRSKGITLPKSLVKLIGEKDHDALLLSANLSLFSKGPMAALGFAGDVRGNRADLLPSIVEHLLGTKSALRKDHALPLALSLHHFNKIPGIHIERELPARQLIISSLLAPHRTSATEIIDSPLLRKLARLYGHYLSVDLHDLTVNLRDAVIMAQNQGVMSYRDRDFFHNQTPSSDPEKQQYIQRAKEIYERTKDPSAYLVYALARVFDKSTSKEALAHVVALNSSLRKGGLEREAHELIHRHKDLVERALNGDKKAIQDLRKLVNLSRLREILIERDPNALHNLGLDDLQNLAPQKWDEILRRAKTNEALQHHVSVVQSLPIASTISTDRRYTLSKLLRQKRFERENMGAYEALIHAIQTGEVARRLTTNIDKTPTHKLLDSVLKILYVDGAIDEGKHNELVKKLRNANNKNLLDVWNETAQDIQRIVHENYHQPFAAVGDLHDVPQTAVETFVGRALDELQRRLEYHARNASTLDNPNAPRRDMFIRRVWYANHKYNDQNLLKKPPEHPFKLLREIR